MVMADVLAIPPGHCIVVDSAFWSTQTPDGRAIDAPSVLLLLNRLKETADARQDLDHD